jgi:hypothetical protein
MSNLLDLLLKRLNGKHNASADQSSADGAVWQDVLFNNDFDSGVIEPPPPAFLDYLSTIPAGDYPVQISAGASRGGGQSASTLPYTTFSTTSGSTVTSAGAKWGGVSFSSAEGYWYPPDNAMAANNAALGDQTVVSSENGAVRIDTFSNNSLSASTQSGWNTLFGAPLSGYFYTDPRVIFDPSAGRFIVTVDEVNTSAGESYFVYAVSNSSAPTSFSSGWTVQPSVSTTHAGTWADQPLVALNGANLYVTTNQFNASGTYQGDNITIISNYASPTSTTLIPSIGGPSYQPATVEDGTSSTQYFISHNGSSLDVIAFNGTTETLVGTVSGMPAGGNFSESQYGSKYKLDAGDGRVTSAVYDARNNELYAIFEAAGSPAPTDELVQINLTTDAVDVVQLNSLLPNSGSTQGAGTFNGSVAVDNNGDLLVNFNVSGPKMYAADYYALWDASNGVAPSPTASNYSALYDYNNSVAAYVDPGRDSVGRWGDYSTALPNPSAANGFYISNEYDNGTVSILGRSYSSWGTVLASVTAGSSVIAA